MSLFVHLFLTLLSLNICSWQLSRWISFSFRSLHQILCVSVEICFFKALEFLWCNRFMGFNLFCMTYIALGFRVQISNIKKWTHLIILSDRCAKHIETWSMIQRNDMENKLTIKLLGKLLFEMSNVCVTRYFMAIIFSFYVHLEAFLSRYWYMLWNHIVLFIHSPIVGCFHTAWISLLHLKKMKYIF